MGRSMSLKRLEILRTIERGTRVMHMGMDPERHHQVNSKPTRRSSMARPRRWLSRPGGESGYAMYVVSLTHYPESADGIAMFQVYEK